MNNKNTKNEIQLLTAKEFGGLLNLSKRQIFRLNSSGKIPAPIHIGGSVRWVNSTIQRWIDMGCPDRKTFEAKQKAEK